MRKLLVALVLTVILCGCDETKDDGASPSIITDTPIVTELPASHEESGSLKAETPSHLNVTVYRQNGEALTLSDYVGVPIVLNFWATWCPPCVREMPHFAKLDSETDDVLFFMINLTDGQVETPEKVQTYLDDSGLTFKNMLLDLDGDVMREYTITGIPTTVFIDEAGSIIDTKVGMLTEEQLRQAVIKLLE